MNVYNVKGEPIGLIDSARGSTRIEAWSTPESLESYSIPENINENIKSQTHLFGML